MADKFEFTDEPNFWEEQRKLAKVTKTAQVTVSPRLEGTKAIPLSNKNLGEKNLSDKSIELMDDADKLGSDILDYNKNAFDRPFERTGAPFITKEDMVSPLPQHVGMGDLKISEQQNEAYDNINPIMTLAPDEIVTMKKTIKALKENKSSLDDEKILNFTPKTYPEVLDEYQHKKTFGVLDQNAETLGETFIRNLPYFIQGALKIGQGNPLTFPITTGISMAWNDLVNFEPTATKINNLNNLMAVIPELSSSFGNKPLNIDEPDLANKIVIGVLNFGLALPSFKTAGILTNKLGTGFDILQNEKKLLMGMSPFMTKTADGLTKLPKFVSIGQRIGNSIGRNTATMFTQGILTAGEVDPAHTIAMGSSFGLADAVTQTVMEILPKKYRFFTEPLARMIMGGISMGGSAYAVDKLMGVKREDVDYIPDIVTGMGMHWVNKMVDKAEVKIRQKIYYDPYLKTIVELGKSKDDYDTKSKAVADMDVKIAQSNSSVESEALMNSPEYQKARKEKDDSFQLYQEKKSIVFSKLLDKKAQENYEKLTNETIGQKKYTPEEVDNTIGEYQKEVGRKLTGEDALIIMNRLYGSHRTGNIGREIRSLDDFNHFMETVKSVTDKTGGNNIYELLLKEWLTPKEVSNSDIADFMKNPEIPQNIRDEMSAEVDKHIDNISQLPKNRRRGYLWAKNKEAYLEKHREKVPAHMNDKRKQKIKDNLVGEITDFVASQRVAELKKSDGQRVFPDFNKTVNDNVDALTYLTIGEIKRMGLPKAVEEGKRRQQEQTDAVKKSNIQDVRNNFEADVVRQQQVVESEAGRKYQQMLDFKNELSTKQAKALAKQIAMAEALIHYATISGIRPEGVSALEFIESVWKKPNYDMGTQQKVRDLMFNMLTGYDPTGLSNAEIMSKYNEILTEPMKFSNDRVPALVMRGKAEQITESFPDNITESKEQGEFMDALKGINDVNLLREVIRNVKYVYDDAVVKDMLTKLGHNVDPQLPAEQNLYEYMVKSDPYILQQERAVAIHKSFFGNLGKVIAVDEIFRADGTPDKKALALYLNKAIQVLKGADPKMIPVVMLHEDFHFLEGSILTKKQIDYLDRNTIIRDTERDKQLTELYDAYGKGQITKQQLEDNISYIKAEERADGYATYIISLSDGKKMRSQEDLNKVLSENRGKNDMGFVHKLLNMVWDSRNKSARELYDEMLSGKYIEKANTPEQEMQKAKDLIEKITDPNFKLDPIVKPPVQQPRSTLKLADEPADPVYEPTGEIKPIKFLPKEESIESDYEAYDTGKRILLFSKDNGQAITKKDVERLLDKANEDISPQDATLLRRNINKYNEQPIVTKLMGDPVVRNYNEDGEGIDAVRPKNYYSEDGKKPKNYQEHMDNLVEKNKGTVMMKEGGTKSISQMIEGAHRIQFNEDTLVDYGRNKTTNIRMDSEAMIRARIMADNSAQKYTRTANAYDKKQSSAEKLAYLTKLNADGERALHMVAGVLGMKSELGRSMRSLQIDYKDIVEDVVTPEQAVKHLQDSKNIEVLKLNEMRRFADRNKANGQAITQAEAEALMIQERLVVQLEQAIETTKKVRDKKANNWMLTLQKTFAEKFNKVLDGEPAEEIKEKLMEFDKATERYNKFAESVEEKISRGEPISKQVSDVIEQYRDKLEEANRDLFRSIHNHMPPQIGETLLSSFALNLLGVNTVLLNLTSNPHQLAISIASNSMQTVMKTIKESVAQGKFIMPKLSGVKSLPTYVKVMGKVFSETFSKPVEVFTEEMTPTSDRTKMAQLKGGHYMTPTKTIMKALKGDYTPMQRVERTAGEEALSKLAGDTGAKKVYDAFERIGYAIDGLLQLQPAPVGRAITFADRITREPKKQAEIVKQLIEMGFSRAEAEAMRGSATQEVIDKANEIADALIYASPNILNKGIQFVDNAMKNNENSPKSLKFIGRYALKMAFTFTKIPVNMAKSIAEMSMPIVPALRGLVALGKGNTNEGYKHISVAFIGWMIGQLSDYLSENGVITGMKPEDDKERSISNPKMTLNLTKLQELLKSNKIWVLNENSEGFDKGRPWSQDDTVMDMRYLPIIGGVMTVQNELNEYIKAQPKEEQEVLQTFMDTQMHRALFTGSAMLEQASLYSMGTTLNLLADAQNQKSSYMDKFFYMIATGMTAPFVSRTAIEVGKELNNTNNVQRESTYTTKRESSLVEKTKVNIEDRLGISGDNNPPMIDIAGNKMKSARAGFMGIGFVRDLEISRGQEYMNKMYDIIKDKRIIPSDVNDKYTSNKEKKELSKDDYVELQERTQSGRIEYLKTVEDQLLNEDTRENAIKKIEAQYKKIKARVLKEITVRNNIPADSEQDDN